MAKPETSNYQATQATPTLTSKSMLALIVSWMIPGGGHMMQKRWTRGILLMASVAGMFALGLAMGGKIYRPNTGDLLDILGFIGDFGAGGLYALGRQLDLGSTAITSAVSDYGTKFIAVAGLLNIMSMVDAYHIAIGKKP